jgi:hypothetical protein
MLVLTYTRRLARCRTLETETRISVPAASRSAVSPPPREVGSPPRPRPATGHACIARYDREALDNTWGLSATLVAVRPTRVRAVSNGSRGPALLPTPDCAISGSRADRARQRLHAGPYIRPRFPRTRMASFGAHAPFELEGPGRGLGPKGGICALGLMLGRTPSYPAVSIGDIPWARKRVLYATTRKK